jgi:hypothetical protein
LRALVLVAALAANLAVAGQTSSSRQAPPEVPSPEDQRKLERWPYSLSLPDVSREEVPFPDVGEFKVLKGDFHVHTFYSDGLVAAEVRVVEAWRDGLDVLALTDHAEYLDIAVPYDRERAYGRALPIAKQLGLMVVRGAELTQHSAVPKVPNPSDFVVHFARDEWQFQTHFDAGLRAAREQGTTIVWAHPGPDWLPIAETLVQRGWLDGIELHNGVVAGGHGTSRVGQAWPWPKVMDWCLKHDLAVFASSDAHWPIDFMYARERRERRDMTLLLARTRDLDGVRDAIRSRRTLACFGGSLWGREDWLRSLVDASLEIRFAGMSGIPSRPRYGLLISNRSGLEFQLRFESTPAARFAAREFRVGPGPATAVPFDLKTESAEPVALDLTITVSNALSGVEKPLILRRRMQVGR